MLRQITFVAIAGIVAVLPSQVIGGGPPWLCLPINGVTSENQQECTDLILENLASKLWPSSKQFGGPEIHQDGSQSYLTFYMKKDVSLSDIDAALKGSEFSIPRDKLRLFGHVILQIDAPNVPSQKLASALDAMQCVSVAKLQDNKGLLLLTVEMPYPVVNDRPKPETVGWEEFAANDYTSAKPNKSESSVTRAMLPGYKMFRDVVASHHAKLNDVRWSTSYACRALGCVMETRSDVAVATAAE
jgi:hypothetical protein